MSRTVRLSLALLFALMMVIATASAALAFDPPYNAHADSAAANMTAVAGFPAVVNGAQGALPGEFPNAGPWHATKCGPPGNRSPASGQEGGPLDGTNASEKLAPIAFNATDTCPPPPPG